MWLMEGWLADVTRFVADATGLVTPGVTGLVTPVLASPHALAHVSHLPPSDNCSITAPSSAGM